MKNVALFNLGCKVNSYEMEGMRQALLEKGYNIVPFDETADIYVVNTCTVTNIADRKSRQMLHRAKQRNPEAVVVAVGCYVQTGREAVEKDESIDLAIGNNRKKDIAEILEKFLREREKGAVSCGPEKSLGQKEAEEGRKRKVPEDKEEQTNSEIGADRGGLEERENIWTPDKTLQGTTILDIAHTREYEEMQLKYTAEHTRAYIKVQDGCNQFCSYCAIPYARGRVRSRSAEDVLREIRGLAEAGYKEVVLTGIHLGSYGIDFDGYRGHGNWGRLIALTEQVHEVRGLERIRLGSLEPRIITPDAAARLAALPKLCPHFHLSLQSGCDKTLKRMNRHYTVGEYYESVEILRECFDNPAITTDVIVGFPGETDEEFSCTESFLEKVGFYEMHIFKFSRRRGTAADRMPDQVPDQVKTLRSSRLLELERRQSVEFRRQYIGREAEVLLEERIETAGKDYWVGHTKDYVKVALAAEADRRLGGNTIVRVPVSGFLTDEILTE